MKQLKNNQILLAEDDEINQFITRQNLARYGIELDVASNGREAVQQFKTKKYGLVLMDLQMPTMNGFEAAKLIRLYEAQNSLEKTPIIALSATISGLKEEDILRFGLDYYLVKPIDHKKINILIEKFL